jgi:hypothetical protein
MATDAKLAASAHRKLKLASKLNSGPKILAALRYYIDCLGPYLGQWVSIPRTQFLDRSDDWRRHLRAAMRLLPVWTRRDDGSTPIGEPLDQFLLESHFEYRIKTRLGIWVLDTEFRELNADLVIDGPMIRYAEDNLALERAKDWLQRKAELTLSQVAAKSRNQMETKPPSPPTILDYMPDEMRRKFH